MLAIKEGVWLAVGVALLTTALPDTKAMSMLLSPAVLPGFGNQVHVSTAPPNLGEDRSMLVHPQN